MKDWITKAIDWEVRPLSDRYGLEVRACFKYYAIQIVEGCPSDDAVADAMGICVKILENGLRQGLELNDA